MSQSARKHLLCSWAVAATLRNLSLHQCAACGNKFKNRHHLQSHLTYFRKKDDPVHQGIYVKKGDRTAVNVEAQPPSVTSTTLGFQPSKRQRRNSTPEVRVPTWQAVNTRELISIQSLQTCFFVAGEAVDTWHLVAAGQDRDV